MDDADFVSTPLVVRRDIPVCVYSEHLIFVRGLSSVARNLYIGGLS